MGCVGRADGNAEPAQRVADAYGSAKLARLSALKRAFDPDTCSG